MDGTYLYTALGWMLECLQLSGRSFSAEKRWNVKFLINQLDMVRTWITFRTNDIFCTDALNRISVGHRIAVNKKDMQNLIIDNNEN